MGNVEKIIEQINACWTKAQSKALEGIDSEHNFEFYPKSESELIDLVTTFYNNKIPYHVVSTGHNWGLGSHWTDREAIINLSKMPKNIELENDFGIATISSSVSQGDLAEYLLEKQSPFFLDVTGSSKHSSVIGNLIERGIAYNSQRVDKVTRMRVLLPTGSIIETGFEPKDSEPSLLSKCYPHRMGPDFKGLFFQSDFGIVLEASLKLEKTSKTYTSIQLKFDSHEDILNASEVFRDLMHEGIIQGIPHMANRERLLSTVLPSLKRHLPAGYANSPKIIESLLPGKWFGFTTVRGIPAINKIRVEEIKKRLKPYCSVRALSSTQLKVLDYLSQKFPSIKILAAYRATSAFRALGFGVPTDDALDCIIKERISPSSDKNFTKKVAQQDNGYLYFLPIAPLKRDYIKQLIHATETICEDHQFAPAVTLNYLNSYVAEAVISITYKKEDVSKALYCLRDLESFMASNNIRPYRIAKFDPRQHDLRDTSQRFLKEIVSSF